jgi:serine-type D-Ala-D-Ala carboxypeptidase (penicillin-binding protein 5/6)
MKRVLAVLLSAVLSLSVAVVPGIQTLAEEPDAAQKTEGQQEAEVEVQAPSAVLMEASTGAVLYAGNTGGVPGTFQSRIPARI